VQGPDLGAFAAEKGRFGYQNRLNLTKNVGGFEVVLLILNGLNAILPRKKEMFFL